METKLTYFERESIRLGVPDWFLQLFVRLANSKEISVGVTLLIGGSLVTGIPISGAEYFKEVGIGIGRAMKTSAEEGAKLFAPQIEEAQERSEEADNSGTESGELAPISPMYIHLRNAQVIHGATYLPTNAGMFWRGRLTSVDGFFVGNLSSGSFGSV